MFVNVIENRTPGNGNIAFIGGMTPTFGKISVPAYFSDTEKYEVPLGYQEVMITGVGTYKGADGEPDWDRGPKHFFIRRPTPEDIKVRFKGFRVTKPNNLVVSTGIAIDGTEIPTRRNCKFNRIGARNYIPIITPGRLVDWVHETDNSDVPHGEGLKPLIPGYGWVRYNPERNVYRLEGVESIRELDL